VAAPAVRTIWDDIYGLEGHKAAVPNGQVPSSTPQVTATGAITAPAGYTNTTTSSTTTSTTSRKKKK
jgi:hypothetical protein